MRQYPIWCDVDAPNYKSDKSFGTRDYTTTDVKIGSSRVNSFDFVKTEIKKSVLDCETQETESFVDYKELHLFEFLVDGVVVKKTIYDPKTKDVISEDIVGGMYEKLFETNFQKHYTRRFGNK